MKFFKHKHFLFILSLLFILNISAFFAVSLSLPENITITKNETSGRWISRGYSWLVTSRTENLAPAMENSSEKIGRNSEESYNEKIYLYGFVPLKNVKVSVSDDEYVTPGGEAIGINLKTKGVLVVGIAPFETNDKKLLSPGKLAGIKTGDVITNANGKKIEKAGQLLKEISLSDKEISLSGKRGKKNISWLVSPEKDIKDGKNKLGIWIRETVAGIGTVSYYKEDEFAALGHSISDIDTGCDVTADGGSVCKAQIIGIEKGEKGSPGSLRGVFSGGNTGKIKTNSYCGVFGTTSAIPNTPKVKIASKNEVRPGDAFIRCNLGGGTRNYAIKISRIVSDANTTKNMIIEITDKELLQKTGGIVQGMSGSPIIQNGKLIGAVTHVFVNDPTRGYGIFIENMLVEAEKIK